MRYISTLIIVASILVWVGCDDKKKDSMQKITAEKSNHPQPQKVQKKKTPKIRNRFTISDIDNRSTKIVFGKNNRIKVSKVKQPIVLINIFASWSPPSCGMIPYLNDLQRAYPKDLFVIGILDNSDLSNKELKEFMTQNESSYFISNNTDNKELAQRFATMLKLDKNYPIPLTIVFKHGEYMMHYIGATPIEMIKADIKQLTRR